MEEAKAGSCQLRRMSEAAPDGLSAYGAERKANLHAPGCGHITTHEGPTGAFGIPEFMPPIRRPTFKIK